MKLPHTGEIQKSDDGIACEVIDTSKVDFSGAQLGRKSAETLVRLAHGGEEIVTRNKEGKIENSYVAKAGDAIFINLHNMNDMYVPGNPDGSRWQFQDLEKKGYVIVGDDHENGGIRVKNGQSFKILHEAVEKPSCIKDAWGPGQHQFLFPGATLKLNDNGSVTGIDQSAFGTPGSPGTWEILSAPSAAPAAQKPPSGPSGRK